MTRSTRFKKFMSSVYVLFITIVIISICSKSNASPKIYELSGSVMDSQGGLISEVEVYVYDDNRFLIYQTKTDNLGKFILKDLSVGSYEASFTKSGFMEVHEAISVHDELTPILNVILDLEHSRQEVTVTATLGEVQDIFEAERPISVVDSDEMERRSVNILPQLLREEPGVHVQQTTTHQGAIFLRGLTGQQTVTLIDGVRFNQSTFRGGPNQYEALIDVVGVDLI